MRALSLTATVIWLACWCGWSLSFTTPVYAEKIPALVEIPADLPLETRVHLMQRKGALEKELARFQAAAAKFNAKDAKDQSDSEYAALDAWRTRYINAAKAFNREVAEAPTVSAKPAKVTGPTIGAASVRGEFSIEYGDGSRLTNTNIQAGSAPRVDIGARVTTGPTGRVQVVLLDETVFTIGPNSDMVIDEFVYDPDLSPRKVSVRVAKGIFRWVTGRVAPKDPAGMKVTLPVGTIGGIRGTDFETFIAPEGSGYVKLFSGEIEITPRKGGVLFVMKEKNMVTFKPDGTFSQPEPME